MTVAYDIEQRDAARERGRANLLAEYRERETEFKGMLAATGDRQPFFATVARCQDEMNRLADLLGLTGMDRLRIACGKEVL